MKIFARQRIQFSTSKKGKRLIFFIICIRLLTGLSVQSQTYTLELVIDFARENSPEALKNKTTKENNYWKWKTYKAEYKPQLCLNANLPNYRNVNTLVLQDDGSIVYRNINQSEAYTTLSMEQNIGLTGGKVYINSDLSRLDDYNQTIHSYSGSPFFIGLEQPLFAFNNLKWMKCIEPLKYEESLKEYVEKNEEIAYYTTVKYFNLLISQIYYQIAFTNKTNADTIYHIGTEKYAMGKISKNELLQLKYGVISAQKSIANASLSIKTSLLELISYTGILETDDIQLVLPDSIVKFYIPDSLALIMAFENSQRNVGFKRSILEARRDAEEARRESWSDISLSVSYGQTNIANNVSAIYENPYGLQTFNVGLTIPILDWGRSKANRKTAEANLKLVEYTVQQEEINFRQEVLTEVENFKMLQDYVEYNAEADKTAAERYEIARLRYIAGDINFTEYNIALEEKDNAKKDYIAALQDYWLTYYSIRILTLYDFKNNVSLID
ncbi:MAG: TolC family protein [Bacteroidales bacterium]|nr:TolC family protein [Bacteroidales bacterium]